ncbi:Ldh family oxidoreductase [Bacillus pinisoli]|uniref:Ldh family oxidoreductase n=1 Tax=Bacillus pinisoli TaxID=2901866 RepID=UPI001FF58E07
MQNITRVNDQSLEDYVFSIFIAAGLDPFQSKLIARHLVLANLRGVDSHGVSRVDIYTKRLDLGTVNKNFNFNIKNESPVSALVDGGNSTGIPLATEGIKLAISKAKQSGIGIVGIHNSNHCGMLADYISQAVEEDCVAFATTNAPANMAPWGGKGRFFGTNPLAYGIPAGEELNIICDMATSKVAKGKIVVAQKNNQTIPLGWALSSEGRPTTDPNEALKGVFLPVGEAKGYGLALLVESFSALMTGAAFGPHIGDLYKENEKQNVGQFFFVMRADLFRPLEEFKADVDQMIKEIRNVPLAENIEQIYLPGEIELNHYEERKANGIPLTQEILNELLLVGKRYNVQPNLIEVHV